MSLGLHHPLAHHHPLAVLPVPPLVHAWLQDRSDRLFDLQEEGIMYVTPLKQNVKAWQPTLPTPTTLWAMSTIWKRSSRRRWSSRRVAR
jgi:hypothetical protein